MNLEDFDISLSHTNKHFDINNRNDVGNLDRILQLIIENKNDQDKLRQILENTTIGYLRRLHEDGLVADSGGPDIVPIFNPLVPSKAIAFKSAGGYTALFTTTHTEDMSPVHITHNETVIGDKVQDSSFRDFKNATTSIKNPPSLNPTKSNARWKIWLSKWWWSFVVPLVVGLILLALEKGWFK